MSNSQLPARVPQEASAEEVAQLIAALDRTSLALSQTSVSVAFDGTFVLNIPIGSFVVSAQPQRRAATTNIPSSAGMPAGSEIASQPVDLQAETTTVRNRHPTLLNVGPTPEEVYQRVANEDPSGQWYVVTCGTDVGVFKHSAEVKHLVDGVSGNASTREKTLSLALEAYTRCWNAGGIRRVSL